MDIVIVLESYLVPIENTPALEAAKYTFSQLLQKGVYILTISNRILSGVKFIIDTFSKKPRDLTSNDIAELIEMARAAKAFIDDPEKNPKVITRRSKLLEESDSNLNAVDENKKVKLYNLCNRFLTTYEKMEPKIKSAREYAKQLDTSEFTFPNGDTISNTEFVEAINDIIIIKRDVEKIKNAIETEEK